MSTTALSTGTRWACSVSPAHTRRISALITTGDSFASFLLGGYNTVSSSGPLVYNGDGATGASMLRISGESCHALL